MILLQPKPQQFSHTGTIQVTAATTRQDGALRIQAVTTALRFAGHMLLTELAVQQVIASIAMTIKPDRALLL